MQIPVQVKGVSIQSSWEESQDGGQLPGQREGSMAEGWLVCGKKSGNNDFPTLWHFNSIVRGFAAGLLEPIKEHLRLELTNKTAGILSCYASNEQKKPEFCTLIIHIRWTPSLMTKEELLASIISTPKLVYWKRWGQSKNNHDGQQTVEDAQEWQGW